MFTTDVNESRGSPMISLIGVLLVRQARFVLYEVLKSDSEFSIKNTVFERS
jgi:hypothetical protein